MSRILVHEERLHFDDISRPLVEEGYEVVVCSGGAALFARLAERRPDVLVYVLSDITADLAVLALLRRVAPRLPLVLLGAPAGLQARGAVHELKPVYYGVFPLDPAELSDAVRAALGVAHAGRAVEPPASHGNAAGKDSHP